MGNSTAVSTWWPWLAVPGTVSLLIFSAFDPFIAVLSLSAIGVLALHAIRAMRSTGHLSPQERARTWLLALGMLFIFGANAAEAEVPENATPKAYGTGWGL